MVCLKCPRRCRHDWLTLCGPDDELQDEPDPCRAEIQSGTSNSCRGLNFTLERQAVARITTCEHIITDNSIIGNLFGNITSLPHGQEYHWRLHIFQHFLHLNKTRLGVCLNTFHVCHFAHIFWGLTLKAITEVLSFKPDMKAINYDVRPSCPSSQCMPRPQTTCSAVIMPAETKKNQVLGIKWFRGIFITLTGVGWCICVL